MFNYIIDIVNNNNLKLIYILLRLNKYFQIIVNILNNYNV